MLVDGSTSELSHELFQGDDALLSDEIAELLQQAALDGIGLADGVFFCWLFSLRWTAFLVSVGSGLSFAAARFPFVCFFIVFSY